MRWRLTFWEARRGWLRFDDIADFYPGFDTSLEHAQTNALAVDAVLADFKGTLAYEAARSRDPSLNDDDAVLPCLSSLVMGNLNAVD